VLQFPSLAAGGKLSLEFRQSFQRQPADPEVLAHPEPLVVH
jgi:hypothetical protein